MKEQQFVLILIAGLGKGWGWADDSFKISTSAQVPSESYWVHGWYGVVTYMSMKVVPLTSLMQFFAAVLVVKLTIAKSFRRACSMSLPYTI